MGKQRMTGWIVVGLYFGGLAVVGPGCAAGGDGSFGDGGEGGEEPWGTGGSSSSGTAGSGGSSSSSASSSSGKPCSGPESCNGLDDDCNGQVDDNVGAAPCNTGLMGVCGVGTTIDCKAGSPTCMQTNGPTAEVCDNLDNDCNGLIDENAPGGGATCMTGLPGPCSLGTTKCVNGAFACVQETAAAAEVCGDTVDNDCNGVVDNGCGMMTGCAHSPCTFGGPLAYECEPCVKLICNIDMFCCTGMWDFTCTAKAADMCPGC